MRSKRQFLYAPGQSAESSGGASEMAQSTRSTTASSPAASAERRNFPQSAGGRPSVLKLRTAQRAFMRGVDEHRLTAFLARRQFGKTTTFSGVAMKKMMKRPNHTVVFGSAKLALSREIVRKEAEILQKAIQAFQVQAEQAKGLLQVADEQTGRIPDELTADDFADLFEAQRLEFRFYHSRLVYSRTKVVALRPDTVGETGDLMCDEIGRVKNWREVWEAVEPIVASDPSFRITLATTPPPDDTHFSFEMLAPPLDAEFPVNPAGNWYRSEYGVWVLRVDAFDAYADSVPVYDLDNAEPLPPEEHRRRSHDKEAWDRNYGVKFVLGGTAACGLLQLDAAQRRGIGKCACVYVESDLDFERGLEFLRSHLGSGSVGIGADLATTEKGTSNPTSVTVSERRGIEVIEVLKFVWKTNDPKIARERFRRIIETVNARLEGGPARRFAIDATNERYFASDCRDEFAAMVPVELVINSETVERPGHEEPITVKAHLGNQYIAELDDNHLTLPPERYVRDDYRRVKRDRGSFTTELGQNGEHGDTFDSGKLALHALISTAGGITDASGIRTGHQSLGRPKFKPRWLHGVRTRLQPLISAAHRTLKFALGSFGGCKGPSHGGIARLQQSAVAFPAYKNIGVSPMNHGGHAG